MKYLIVLPLVFLTGCGVGIENDRLQERRYAEYQRVQKYNTDMCMKSSGTIVLSQWDWHFVECKIGK